jgi:hypothetical protein
VKGPESNKTLQNKGDALRYVIGFQRISPNLGPGPKPLSTLQGLSFPCGEAASVGGLFHWMVTLSISTRYKRCCDTSGTRFAFEVFPRGCHLPNSRMPCPSLIARVAFQASNATDRGHAGVTPHGLCLGLFPSAREFHPLSNKTQKPSGRPGLAPVMFGSAFGTATFFCLGEFGSWVSGLRKTARHSMHFLSPADAFLVIVTLGTAVLIEIAAFILIGLI